MDADGMDSDVWELFAEPSRRAICMQLAGGPRAVGELAARLPISRPAVSQHLRVLKTAGLVTDDVVGTRHLYRLNPVAVAAFRDQLDTFWSRALAGYAATASPPGPVGPAGPLPADAAPPPADAAPPPGGAARSAGPAATPDATR